MRHRFNIPFVAGREAEYVADVLAGTSHAGNGPYTRRCQALMEARYDAPHVLLTTSCTAALELAALSLELEPGDEVILPSYTFSSTASAFLRVGARVVFAEVDAATMMLDPRDVERRLTPRTRAVVAVHYAGVGCAVDELDAICADRGIALVEDAAQGLDAKVGGRWLGRFGRLSAFSFHETKNIHCGLGGALFVNDASMFDRIEDRWERGTDRAKLFRGLVDKYRWVELGSSFYPSELQAAFLLAQLEEVDRNRHERLALWRRYRERLAPAAERGAFALQRVDADRDLNGHALYVLGRTVAESDALREALLADGIAAFIGYVPLHTSPMGERLGYAEGDLPITEATAPRVLRLPLHNHMTIDDVDQVCDAVVRFTERAR